MLVSLIAAAAAAAAAPAAPAAAPSFSATPTGEQVLRFYPPAAQAAEVGGRATLACKVQADGSVSDCTVASETPADWGFGKAALSLAPYFQVKQPAGAASTQVNVPILFRMADPPNELTPYRCYGALADSSDPKAAQYAQGLGILLKEGAARVGVSAADAEGLLARAKREITGAEKATLAQRCADGL